MKNIFTLSVFVFILGFSSKAQITLDSTSMPYVGWSEGFAKDTPLTTINYGNAGANQTYDFHTLTSTNTSTAVYSAPTNVQHTHFPSANLMATSDNINYIAAQKTATKYIAEGDQTTLTSGHIAYTPFSPLDDVFHFPTQYLGNFTGSWGFSQAVSAADAGQGFPVDSVFLTYTDTYYDTIDGWGTVKTPLGTYNCLREARHDITHTHIVATLSFGGPVTQDTYSDAVTYQYLAKETKGAVVKFDYDTGVNAAKIKDAQYALIPPTPIAGFTFVTGASGLVTFTNTSTNSPTSYSWNFGDGSALNTSQSPTHTYANDGTYYVCETVTNVSGSNTYCDSVHITNVPGPTAHFTWGAAGGGLIDFTNQNTGNPTTYHWTFGDGDTSNTANPNHTYAANGTYYACETVNNVNGSNTYCDSVHVTEISGTHQAPVAVGDTASVIKPNSVNVNVTANDYSPSADTFCIKSISNPTYFTVSGCHNIIFNSTNAPAPGTDSTWYVICNVSQPTLCDSALLIVTVEKAHVPPVAVNDYDTVTQASVDTINVTLNDYSPSGDSFCITGGYGPGAFSPFNCNEIIFTPDSTFTGNDTAWYIICNTGQPSLCDTGEVIVTVTPNAALLPVVSFRDSLVVCGGAYFFNTSTADSGGLIAPMWQFHDLSGGSSDSTATSNTAHYLIGSGEVQVCLTVYNQYGSSSKCDTVEIICGGINYLSLSNISIYPNPTNNVLTIDMLHNTDDITADYTALEIYNAIGQQVLSKPRDNQYKLVNIPVTALPEGMYLATIVDSKGVKRTLGKFTVVR